MLLISKIVNLGVNTSDEIHLIRLKRQVNGLNLFYFIVAISAFFMFYLFIPNSIVLQVIQVIAILLYFSYLVLNNFGKINITRISTIYTFEIQLFLIALFSNAFQSPVIYIFVLYPILAGLVEEPIFRHLAVALAAVAILMGLHYIFPAFENIIMNISRFEPLKIQVLVIMSVTYIPIMASVIIQIILKENQRARKMQKEMQLTETKYSENKKYLDNINEGLLLINKDLIISNQYSKFILSIIGSGDISGKNFIDIVYPDSEKNNDERTALEQYLSILFCNNTASAAFLKSANPLKNKYIYFKGQTKDSEEKIVKVSFQRIFKDKDVEDIMALFVDETSVIHKERELEKEKTRKETEMESITAILKQGPQTFSDFIEATNNILDQVELNINKLEEPEKIEQILKDLHSLKGFARVLELNKMADELHRFENIFAELRDKNRQTDSQLKEDIIQFCKILSVEKMNIKRLLDLILSFNRFNSKTNDSKAKILLNNFLISLNDMVNSISQGLDKNIHFITHAEVDDFPYLNKLRNAIIHLIRNSIDHGIEDKFARLSNNKNLVGKIIFKLYKDSNDYFVEVIDDGGGLNFETIKKKALEKNIPINDDMPFTDRELLNLIFSSDFSSKNEVTDVSGRGIGLNVVKKDVEKLNGKISVSTEKGKGTKFVIKIPDNKLIYSADPLLSSALRESNSY